MVLINRKPLRFGTAATIPFPHVHPGREGATIALPFSLAEELTMAVNSPKPVAADLKAVAGIEIGVAEAGIKKPNRKDLLVLKLAAEYPVARVAALSTPIFSDHPPTSFCYPCIRAFRRFIPKKKPPSMTQTPAITSPMTAPLWQVCPACLISYNPYRQICRTFTAPL